MEQDLEGRIAIIMVSASLDRHGRIDILVNNAGTTIDVNGGLLMR